MNWILFWVAALATYRITVLFVRCLGPWNVFWKLRNNPSFHRLLSCVYCTSIWASAVVCAVLFSAGLRMELALWILLVFAFSALTIFADRVFSSDHLPQP